METVVGLSIRAELSLIIGSVFGFAVLIGSPLTRTIIFDRPPWPPMWALSLLVGLG